MERRCKRSINGITLFCSDSTINAGTLVFEWNSILVAALGGVAYLTKNFSQHHKKKLFTRG
jgi:hypothetical protein